MKLSEAGSLLLAAAGQPELTAAAATAASPQPGAAAAPPAAGKAPSDNTWQLVYSGSRPGSSGSSSSSNHSSSSGGGGVAALARPRRPTAAPCTAVGQPAADPRLVRLTQQLIACTSQAQVVAVLAAERLAAPDARRLLTYLARQGATGAAVAAFRGMKTLRQPGAGAHPVQWFSWGRCFLGWHCCWCWTENHGHSIPMVAAPSSAGLFALRLNACACQTYLCSAHKHCSYRQRSPAAACPLLRTKLIRMHSKRVKDTGVALALYDEMRQDGIAPDAVCFNTCLTAAGERWRVWRWQRGRADGAQGLIAHSQLACRLDAACAQQNQARVAVELLLPPAGVAHHWERGCLFCIVLALYVHYHHCSLAAPPPLCRRGPPLGACAVIARRHGGSWCGVGRFHPVSPAVRLPGGRQVGAGAALVRARAADAG